MKTIFIKELQESLAGNRFYLIFAIIILLFAINGFLYSKKYETMFNEYNDMRLKTEDEISKSATNFRSLARAVFFMYLPPARLDFISDGKYAELPNSLRYRVDFLQSRSYAVSQNNAIKILIEIDWMFIIIFVLSFLGFILSYDAVSGEKENGTLAATFSNAISRFSLISGKLLASLVLLFGATLTGVISCLIIINITGKIPLQIVDYWKIVIILLIVACYIVFIISLGIVVSMLTRKSFTSLVVLSLIWVVLVIVIPKIGYLFINKIYPIPTFEEIQNERDKIREYYLQKLKNLEYIEFQEARSKKWFDTGNDDWRVTQALFNKLMKQVNIIKSIANISPFHISKSAIEKFLFTGMERYPEFIQQGRTYFTTYQKLMIDFDKSDPDSRHWFLNYISEKPVSTEALPQFHFREPGIGESLKQSLFLVLILFIETAAILTIANVAFFRADLRTVQA